jgi:hypothetical protein
MLVDGSRGIERILGRPRPPNEVTSIFIIIVSWKDSVTSRDFEFLG